MGSGFDFLCGVRNKFVNKFMTEDFIRRLNRFKEMNQIRKLNFLENMGPWFRVECLTRIGILETNFN